MSYLLHKLKRRLLNLALAVIKRHVQGQPNLFVYTYDRERDNLTPITWKARGVTNQVDGAAGETSDASGLGRCVDVEKKVVVDVGASLGLTVAHFAKTARVVYALEPQVDNYAFLLDQIRIRALDNVAPFNRAISDFNGKAAFFNRESHGVHSLGDHNKGKVLSHSEVKVITLDDFWKQEIREQIGLLKVDVEGFETEVFRGASHLLKNKLIDSIIFEFSPRIHTLRGIPIDAPLEILLQHGYNLFRVDGAPFELDLQHLPKVCDLIALPAQPRCDAPAQ